MSLVGLLSLAVLVGQVSAGDVLFGGPQLISNTIDGTISVHAADLDGDGDLDVLTASWHDDTVAWYENTDGMGSFGPRRVISAIADRAYSVDTADFDDDGDLDVLAASFADNTVAWYENTDGLGTFGPLQVITTAAVGVWSAQAADLDGDGDPDVVSASDTIDTIAWYENTDGLGTFGPPIILSTTADGAVNVFVADLDGDLDNDLLTASALDGTFEWFENTDGLGTFSAPHVINSSSAGARSVHAIDLDGDMDLDVLTASGLDNKIAWHENIDGSGTFGPRQVINDMAFGARTVWGADLDGDGDADVLSASVGNNTVAWYENIDGLGDFGAPQVITNSTEGAYTVRAYDFDCDGDNDVLVGAALGDLLLWFENTASPWSDLGGGTIGIAGQPTLVGCGSLVPATPASVSLTNAPPGAFMLAWIAFAPVPSFPVLGGTMHAFPVTTQLIVFADGSGEFTGATSWPSGLLPGTDVWFQFLVEDLSKPQDISLSNGLRATTP